MGFFAAAALQRWDGLNRAVDFLIECQKVILQWWHDRVHADGRPSKELSHDRGTVSKKDAPAKIGFSDTVD